MCPRLALKTGIGYTKEPAATSGMFKDALARRRCLVRADAFYEWKVIEGGKQPYAIAREDGQPMAFAGLWEGFRWPDETMTRSFTILTTTPNAEMAASHDRMPGTGGPEGDRADVPRILSPVHGRQKPSGCRHRGACSDPRTQQRRPHPQ